VHARLRQPLPHGLDLGRLRPGLHDDHHLRPIVRQREWGGTPAPPA
jgi:hypothetical protein